jgi:hypothetical protein
MNDQSQEQRRGVRRRDAHHQRADDIPNNHPSSPTPDSAAPILRSEDDLPHDEDTPE